MIAQSVLIDSDIPYVRAGTASHASANELLAFAMHTNIACAQTAAFSAVVTGFSEFLAHG